MNNSSKSAQTKYPIAFVVRVFPLIIAIFVIICVSHIIFVIWLAVKFQFPLALIFCILFLTGLPLYAWTYLIAIVKWQIWAYNSVEDIRELDSMQPLLSFLCIEDFNQYEMWLSKKDRASRKAILERYYGPYHFKDDPTIGNATTIGYTLLGWAHLPGMRRVVLSNTGIECPNGTFYRWEALRLDDVIYKRNRRTSNKYFLSYQCPNEWVEIPLNWLAVDYLHLKHLLYVYRTRHSISTGELIGTEVPVNNNTPVPYNVSNGWPKPAIAISIALLKLAQKTKGLLIFILSIAFIFLIHAIFPDLSGPRFSKRHYSGFVTEKKYYKEIYKAPQHYITIEGQEEDVAVNSVFYDTVSVGDYIIKKEGELRQILVKGNDTLIFDNENYY